MKASQRLEALEEKWHGCTRCPLHKQREGGQIVFGGGPVPADIMLIGSYPSESDEFYNTPFTGDSGAILIELLNSAEIDPESVYITHIVGCRPKIIIPATELEEERVQTVAPSKEHFLGQQAFDKGGDPIPEETWEGCHERVHSQIYEVDPRIIITFGKAALDALDARSNLGKRPKKKMAEAVGELYEITIPGKLPGNKLWYPVLALFDVEMLLKNPSNAAHGPASITSTMLTRARRYVEWIQHMERKGDEDSHGRDGRKSKVRR